MKKLFVLICVLVSVVSFGQNKLIWVDGELYYGTPVKSLDMLTAEELQ